jgi:protoheme IX farnesyltransferase
MERTNAMKETAKLLYLVGKLRIGFAIMLSALAGMAVTPGIKPGVGAITILALAVLFSSAAAGAFNHVMERDLDARMARTRARPFVTGRLNVNGWWYAGIAITLFVAVAAATFAANAVAALYTLLGAFVYGVVYTVWLKRRTWLNIVVGGLAGSFAVLAGAAAVNPTLAPAPLILAVVMFLWTPPHFWSLAYVYRDDYAQAGVPMLPVVASDRTTARAILAHTLPLVLLSFVPVWYGRGAIYLVCALVGGLWFVRTSVAFARKPERSTALRNFHASLAQLSLLVAGCLLDAAVH